MIISINQLGLNQYFKFKYLTSDNILDATYLAFKIRDCKIVCVRMNDSLNLFL